MTVAGTTAPPAREAEAIEQAALAALHAAADPATVRSLGLALERIDGGLVSIAARLPASAIVVNRALGLGSGGDLAPGTIAAVAARFRAAGVPRFFLGLERAALTPAVEAACRAAGLGPARGWQHFVRERGADPGATAAVAIHPVGPADAAAFARIVCAAFDLGAAAEPWLARLPGAPGFHAFLARVDGVPAGTGSLFVRGGIGWCDWGATAPAFRRRGVQRALLAHRCRLADALGLARLHTETGEAVPGEAQHSFRNILRCGFRPTSVRPNRAPPKP